MSDKLVDFFFQDYIPSISRTMDYIREYSSLDEYRWGSLDATRTLFRTLIKLEIR